ncbi:MAG: CinA family protein, partial [Clostridia bacterium]|nr:CinA family protein [Deltaproteobacteria bacterium]
GAKLILAESCTGGLVGDLLTDIPGSSDVFLGSFVVYANQLKESPLGVPNALIAEYGAVSEPVVLAMADGARKLIAATYAIAISGIAGPGGGGENKPVGTTCIALVSDTRREARTMRWPFDRRRNKVVSAYTALDWLRRIL